MPCWYWDKKDLENSPSRKAGVTPENENRYRKEGSRFIYKLGQGMKLHHDTLASAAVFYHRFYQIHSFSKFRSRYVTATCCLFLAGKVEETPKKWTDLIKGARQILQPAQFQQFGTMEEAKDELMAMERVLLQTIKFDFNIEHAHKFIIQYCEDLRDELLKSLDEEKIKEMVQQSWNFANDSYYTNLCLQWEPQIIAICMIYLAGKIQKIQALGYQTHWWHRFIADLERDLIEQVCHQVLDIYSKPNNKKSSSTPAKGATPAKKQKLDPSANQNTPVQNEVTKQLHALLNNIPAEKLEKVKKTSGLDSKTPSSTPSKKGVNPPTPAPVTPIAAPTYDRQNSQPPTQRYHTPQAPKRSHSMNQSQWSTPQPQGHQGHYQGHQGQMGGPYGGGGGGGHQGPGQFPVQGGWPDEAPSGHRNYGGGGRNNYRGNFSGRGRGGHGRW